MSKRTDPCRKRPAEILADLLEGHRQAAFGGPAQARKYLERVIDGNKSLPNASKFFVYDLLAEACAKTGAEERRDEAVAQALHYLPFAQEDAPRECKAYLPEIRCFERGIAAAVEGSVSAMLQSQEAGQRLGDDLRTLCGQLQEVWGRHEARFIGVDESVARILTSIIQHTEAHGDALRTQVVAIDTHLAHAVNSLAANIEALHEITADLTAAAGKTDGAPPPAAVSPAAVSPAALSPAIAPPPPPVPVRAVADTMMFSPDRLRDI